MSTLKMAPPEKTSLEIIFQFISNSWPFVIAIVSIWKGIAEVGKYVSTKQEAKLRALVQSEIKEPFARLETSLDNLANRFDKMIRNDK